MIVIAMLSDSNVRKKEYDKLEKHQGLKEKLEKLWKEKAKIISVIIGALGVVTPKLKKWL